jgi:hypothetical protein
MIKMAHERLWVLRLWRWWVYRWDRIVARHGMRLEGRPLVCCDALGACTCGAQVLAGMMTVLTPDCTFNIEGYKEGSC